MKNENLIKNIGEKINIYTKKEPLSYDSGEDCLLLLYSDVFIDDFHAVSSLLVSDFHFEIINENTIENNFFKFLKKGDLLVCFGYFECDNTIRVVFDSNTCLPVFGEPQVTERCKTTVWQFEVDHSLIDCGMCYIVRLSTGSFFVIDSAHTYSINDCERIHDFLRERTPEGEKIHISGWFITHGHDDHVAQFTNYLNFYMQDTIIDKVYMNLISLNHRDGKSWDYFYKNYDENTRKAIAAHPEIELVRLHTGMTFFVDNLKLDVLCSHEDVFPNDNSNYNDSSVVLMMSAKGSKVLITGDAGHEESYILEARYPTYLKSDVVQQAHHCHFGTTEHFYELVGAECVLFPATQIKFDETWDVHAPNRKSIEIAEGNYFIASNGTVEIDLPYVKGEEKLYPDETFESFKGVFDLWTYSYTSEYKEKLYKEYLARGGKPLDEYKDGFQ